MYDLNDPVARYYDFSFAVGSESESEYYRSFANEVSGPVADLCCGTGVLTCEIATASKKVHAIDSSDSMLDVLRAKKPRGHQIEILQSSMTCFSLPETVDRVFCRDAFFHNLTPTDQRETLVSVQRALSANGVLAFNIHVPHPRFLASLPTEPSDNFTERGRYSIPKTEDQVVISQTSTIDYFRQQITTRLKFETYDNHDRLKATEHSSWTSRYTFPHEMFYLLELTGFEIRNAWGTYDRTPWDEGSMLIVEAKKVG